MNPSPKTLFKPFKPDLDTFQDYFKRVMASNVRLVDLIAKYLVRHKGKQFRPMLVITAARTISAPTERTYLAAVVVELLHTATLVHDDVIDESEIRRGFWTINKIWKNKISILMGDYLLAKSLITATEIGSLELMNLIANVARRMSQGELLQIQKSWRLNISEDEYFQLISDKTASLISACCELGAITTDASETERSTLRRFGEHLGIAFQIKDDLLDYQSHPGIVGKPVGNDLKDKKITLPLLYALQSVKDGKRKKIIRLVKRGVRRKELDLITGFIEEQNGIERAEEKACYHKKEAVEALKNLQPSIARDILENLAEFVILRKK